MKTLRFSVAIGLSCDSAMKNKSIPLETVTFNQTPLKVVRSSKTPINYENYRQHKNGYEINRILYMLNVELECDTSEKGIDNLQQIDNLQDLIKNNKQITVLNSMITSSSFV